MDKTDLEVAFDALVEQWEQETRYISDSQRIHGNENYQKIIALGPAVLPLIFARMEQTQDAHWCKALRQITGEDPVPKEHWGDVQACVKDWLDWYCYRYCVKESR